MIKKNRLLNKIVLSQLNIHLNKNNNRLTIQAVILSKLEIEKCILDYF